MKKVLRPSIVLMALFALTAVAASAQDPEVLEARLRSYHEVPSVSTSGRGTFHATVSRNSDEIEYTLSYRNLQGNVLQAHLHFAEPGVNGGIMIFLCSNLGNGPAGTQPCPPGPTTISGTLTAAGMVNTAASQGISQGQFIEMLRAIRAGAVYANVHSNLFPGGEIRGQVLVLDGERTPEAE